MKLSALMSRFVAKTKHNAPTILAVVGTIGVGATMIFTAKGAVEAYKKIEDEEKAEGELETKEKVKLAIPYYLLPIALGTGTCICILTGNHLSTKQQASLLAAYTMLGESFREYKQKTIDICGEEKAKEIEKDIAEDYLKDVVPSEDDDIPLWYDQFTGRYFNAPVDQIRTAIYKINRNFALDSYASLNEFLLFCSRETFNDYPEIGEHMGWDMIEMCDAYDAPGLWLDISWETVIMDDGLKVNILEYEIPPFDEDQCTVGEFEGLAKRVDI